jgi:hypothetical protein
MDNTFQIARNANESFLFTLLFFGVWFIFPFACIFLFPLLLFKFTFDKRVENFMLLLIAISFGLVAYTTRSTGTTDSDIARYTSLYKYIATVNTPNRIFISIVFDGANNILFYFVMFLMTRIFPANPQVLPLFWVSGTYFFSFLTIKEYVQYFSLPRKKYILLLFFACMGIITFYTTTEIIKQTASVAIMGYAIILNLREKKAPLFFVIISVLTHFSSLLLLPVYFFCKRAQTVFYIPFIFFICLIFSFFNFNILLYNLLSPFMKSGSDLLMRVQYYEDVETWTISLRFYAVFAMYFLLVGIFYWDYLNVANNEEKKKKQSLLIVHSLAFFVLLVNRSNVHNFIRYVLGYFPFYLAAVIQLFYTRIARFDKTVVICLVLGFYLYSNVKMIIAQTTSSDYANSYMNNDLLKIATSNVVQFLNFRTAAK